MLNKKVKILVAYHKKAPLIKSDIFVPIHVGRTVAQQVSKDGVVSNKDISWLQKNMIGDDTGENISYLNRDFCELSAIYWAWKNYDKLGNPDYIGLCHYRRCFFSNSINKLNKITYKKFFSILKNHDCIFPEKHVWNYLEQPFDGWQMLIKLSKKYHKNLYDQYIQYKKNNDKKTFICNMFILNKKDFFQYCKILFDVLFDIYYTKNLISTKKYRDCILWFLNNERELGKTAIDDLGHLRMLPRMYGYIAEILSNFIFMNFIKKGRNALLLPIKTIDKKSYASINNLPQWLIKKFNIANKTTYYILSIIPILLKKRVSSKEIYKLFCFINIKHKNIDEWKQKNLHNETYCVNRFDISKVSVGKKTYGPLYVTTSGAGTEKLIIGSFCSIGPNVIFILSSEHNYRTISTYPFLVKYGYKDKEALSKGDIVVDDDVWIGANCVINSGVHIGKGAVIASGSVVTKDVDPYAIVGGNPAKFIRYRFSNNIIKLLMDFDFSDLSDECVKSNIDVLYDSISADNIKCILKKLKAK